MALFTGLNQPFVSTNKLVLFKPKPSDGLSANVITDHKSLLACRRVASAQYVTLSFGEKIWQAGQCDGCQTLHSGSVEQQGGKCPPLLPSCSITSILFPRFNFPLLCLFPLSFTSIFILFIHCTRWRSWLRHCATSQKVAGSIPDGDIILPTTLWCCGRFIWLVLRADNLTTFMWRNLTVSIIPEPSEPVRGLYSDCFTFTFISLCFFSLYFLSFQFFSPSCSNLLSFSFLSFWFVDSLLSPSYLSLSFFLFVFTFPRSFFHTVLPSFIWYFSDRASWIDYTLITNVDALIIIYL